MLSPRHLKWKQCKSVTAVVSVPFPSSLLRDVSRAHPKQPFLEECNHLTELASQYFPCNPWCLKLWSWSCFSWMIGVLHCVCLCMHMHVLICLSVQMPVHVSSSGTMPHAVSTLVWIQGLLQTCTDREGWAGCLASSNYRCMLSLPSSCWDYRCLPQCSTFVH